MKSVMHVPNQECRVTITYTYAEVAFLYVTRPFQLVGAHLY